MLNTLLFFPSGAIYPINAFPKWLQAIAIADPFSYAVHAFKALLLKEAGFTAIWYDLLFLTVFAAVMISNRYPAVQANALSDLSLLSFRAGSSPRGILVLPHAAFLLAASYATSSLPTLLVSNCRNRARCSASSAVVAMNFTP